LAAFHGDESKAFRVVEPLDRTGAAHVVESPSEVMTVIQKNLSYCMVIPLTPAGAAAGSAGLAASTGAGRRRTASVVAEATSAMTRARPVAHGQTAVRGVSNVTARPSSMELSAAM